MSKLTSSSDFGNIADLEGLKRWLTIWAGDVTAQINGGINFGTNINGNIIDVIFTAANTEQAVTHSLNKIPTGYVMMGTSASTVLYNGSTTNTVTVMYLKASAAATVKIFVF